MLSSLNTRKNIKTILFYLIINLLFGIYKWYNYNITAKKENNELDFLNFKNEENCKKIIHSLFHSKLLVNYDYSSTKIQNIQKELTLNIPYLSSDNIKGSIYYFKKSKCFNDLNIYLAKNDEQTDSNCYFGLSLGFPNDTEGLNDGEDSLSF